MSSGKASRPKPQLQTLMTGLAFGESPRWHDGRLWVSDWGTKEIIALDREGHHEVMVRLDFPSFQAICMDWLPDGRLLIVSSSAGLVLYRQPDGSLVTYADLNGLSNKGWNEIVVDGRGNTYVNGGGFKLGAGEKFAPGIIALVTPDGLARQMADGIAFPNGMAVTPDNATLIVAESYATKLTAFDIAADGSLSKRRVWADLGDGVPDGICIDAEGAVWYADVPNKCCVRVREGGEVLQTVELDRGGFACMLGGEDRKTLFIVAREWRGMESTTDAQRTGQVLSNQAPAAGAGWP
jgi:sugar lactone lactonase YvrE